jgi:hypothetical protein
MEVGDRVKERIDESIRIYDKLLLILSEHSGSCALCVESSKVVK